MSPTKNSICNQCGKVLTGRRRLYCSTACGLAGYRAKNKDRINAEYKKWYRENGRKRKVEKEYAHHAIYRAIRRGDIVRPLACEKCGETERKIEAHHNDYAKKLDVLWLCNYCHRQLHRGERGVNSKETLAQQTIIRVSSRS